MLRTDIGRAVAEINEQALIQNYQRLHAFAAAHSNHVRPRTIAVVKANAYGHGFLHTVPPLLRAGCRFFAVATLCEALAVRRYAPNADILILGYTDPRAAKTLSHYRLTQTVFSEEYAQDLAKFATVSGCFVKIHLKIDVGMCRLGFAPTDLCALCRTATLPHLLPCGLFTHFPKADSDAAATHAAFCRFLACRRALQERGFRLFSHAAASAALLKLPYTVLDGVRVGLALYGIPPVKTALPLQPVLSLRAPVIQIHRIAAGTSVGYGGAFVATRPSKIGILPIGYGDGLPRRFEKSVVTVRVFHQNTAFLAPVAGHICMDMMALDLTDTPIEVGDHALLFDDPRPVARALDTIPWEILTSLHPRIFRKRR